MNNSSNSSLTLLKNLKLIDVEQATSSMKDVLVKNATRDEESIILDIKSEINTLDIDASNLTVYNAHSKIASPGFIDLHCHLRDPGYEYKEDIITGTQAAVAGGYSAVLCMPNTKPVIDNADTLDYVMSKAQKWGACRVFPTAAITEGQNGKVLCDYKLLTQHGAVAFTDDGKPVSDSSVMLEAMKRCAESDYLIISHCEEVSLSVGGSINDGKVSRLLGVKGITNAAEDIMIARDIILAEQTGCRLHIAHVSTRGGLQLIREAKKRGVCVTCETCPHYFSFCDEDVVFYGVNAKMSPPLRSRVDMNAVIEAIKDGTIDCISTDHAPHSESEKGDNISSSANGIIGLQTAFAAGVTYLVMPGHIDIYKLVSLMTLSPAKISRLYDKGFGKIEIGGKADITIFSIDKENIITKNMIKSRSCNTPFIGLALCGTINDTFINGGKR